MIAARLRIMLGLVLALSGCAQGSSAERDAGGRLRGDPVVIGSFDFTESRILAHVYAAAIESAGEEATVAPTGGSREMLEPALEQGVVDLVPEYQGAALAFLSGETSPRSPAETHTLLKRRFAERDIAVLGYARAQNQNALVVTSATADKHDLRTISDLREIAPQLTFGGPAECEERVTCLKGLAQVYDLHFAAFHPLNATDAVAAEALGGEEVDVALLFTTDPVLSERDLVVLVDDRHLQPAENVVVVVRDDRLRQLGADAVSAIERVTRNLTTGVLRKLNAQGADPERSPADIARGWVDKLDDAL